MPKNILVRMVNVPGNPIVGPAVQHYGNRYVQIPIDMLQFYHHMYFAMHGGPGNFQGLRAFNYWRFFISPNQFLRFNENGRGANRETRACFSNTHGHGMCQMLLRQYFRIDYFAPLPTLPDVGAVYHLPDIGEGPATVTRVRTGDMPDYLCSTAGANPLVFAAEAKGRSQSFGGEIATWRQQFDRIAVNFGNNPPGRLKGYLVATRFVGEADGPRVRPTVYIEDPYTVGKKDISENQHKILHRIIKYMHYRRILHTLNLPMRTEHKRKVFHVRHRDFPNQTFVTGIPYNLERPHFLPCLDQSIYEDFLQKGPDATADVRKSIRGDQSFLASDGTASVRVTPEELEF